MYVAGWVGVTGRCACCDAPDLPVVLFLDGCAPDFDECALEVDGFPDLLVAARFDLLDGISRTVMADVTNYQSQTHQFRYKQDSDPEAVRRSPDMAAMAE